MRKASKLLRSLFVLACFLFLWSVTGCPHPIEPEPTNVTVTFESNGGSVVEPITIEKGNSIEKPADPIKNGYVFSGWYIGTSKIEFPYTPEDNVTLQAAWNLEVYSIEYVLSELATNDPSNPTEYTIESEEIKVEDLKAPALKTGAKFLGWFVDEEFKTEFVSIKTGSTGNVKIYGRITDGATYTVTYYLPGDATAKTKVVAENDVFTLTGYDFYTDKDLKNPYNGAKITSNITLYAKAKMFKVTFDPANGSASTVVECEYNKAVKVPSEEPTPIDNKTFFAGWYLGDKQYDFEKPITGDITLTAKWNKPFEKVTQLNNMPVISITANYLATSDEEDKYKEKNVNDFVKLPVAKSVKEQTAGQDWAAEYAKAPVPFYKESTISVMDENGNIALCEATGKVKVRGNWTTTYKKKPLRIKFDEKQSMLGLNEGNVFKNWVLLASYKDRSFLRDITGYTLGKLLSPGYYASDFKLVEVYVNGEYFGVYILAEQQEVKKNRINIDDAEKNSSTETGYLIEYDRYYEFEDANTVFELKHGSEVKDRNGEIVSEFNIENKKGYAGYTIKNDLNNTAQKTYITEYMQNLWEKCFDAVTTKTEDEAKAVIEQYIDIQSLVDTYLLQEIVCDPDLYITSFFMTLDMSASGTKKLTFQAPWDFDSTMGNKRHDANDQGLYAGVVGYDVNHVRRGTGNPWMMLLVNQSWFNDMVKTKWNAEKDSLTSTISTQISNLTSKYATNFENNYKKWPMEDNNEYRPEAAACKTQSAAASQLGSWLYSRSETLEKGINNFKEKDFSKYESEYITAESTEKGIKIIFTLKDGEDFNYDWSGIKETSTQLKYNFVKQDDRSFEFYFPFVEKDTFYEFAFEGEIIKNKVPKYDVPGFSIKSKYEYIPLDVSVLQDFNENSITECNIQKHDSGALSYSLITTNTRSENVATMCSQKIGEKGSYRKEIMGVWGDSSWNNTSLGWSNSVQDLTDAVTKNYKDRDTYQVSVKFVINVDGNTWKTKDIWSDLYEFDLWKGVIYENEADRDPKTAWFSIYLFNNSDAYGLLAWGSNAGSSNPQCLDGLLGNYERNGNEITLYDPYDSERTFVLTINGDVMTSEDPLFSGVEFTKK